MKQPQRSTASTTLSSHKSASKVNQNKPNSDICSNSSQKPIQLHKLFTIEMQKIWKCFQLKLKEKLSEEQQSYCQLYRILFQKYRQQTLHRLQNSQNNRKFQILTDYILKKHELNKKIVAQDCQLSQINFKENYEYSCEKIKQTLEETIEEGQKVYKEIMWLKNNYFFKLKNQNNSLEINFDECNQKDLFEFNPDKSSYEVSDNKLILCEQIIKKLSWKKITQLILNIPCIQILQECYQRFNFLQNLKLITSVQSIKQILLYPQLFNIAQLKHLYINIQFQSQKDLETLFLLLNEAKSVTLLEIIDNQFFDTIQLNSSLIVNLQSLKIKPKAGSLRTINFPILRQLEEMKNIRQLSIDLSENPQTDFVGFKHLNSFLKISHLMKLHLNFTNTMITQNDFFLLTHAIKKLRLYELQIEVEKTEISYDSVMSFIHIVSCLENIKMFKLRVSRNRESRDVDKLKEYWKMKIGQREINDELNIENDRYC